MALTAATEGATDYESLFSNFSSGLVTSTATPQNTTSSLQYRNLVFAPCIALWLMTPAYAVVVARRPVYNAWTTFSKLGASKLTAVVVLIGIALFRLIDGMIQPDEESTSSLDLIASLCLVTSLMLVTVYIQWIFHKGLHTSLPLFVFWFLLLFAKIVAVVSKAYPFFALVYVELALIALEFVLSCVSDQAALGTDLASESENTLLLGEIGRKSRANNNPCPKESASIMSLTMFAWFFPQFIRGLRRTHKVSGLWNIMEEYSAEVNHSKFNKQWGKELAKECDDIVPSLDSSGSTQEQQPNSHRKISLNWALVRTFLPYFSLDFLFIAGFIATSFTAPMLLQSLIRFIDGNDPHKWKGYILAMTLCFVSYATNLCLEHHFDTAGLTSLKISSALISAIYRKALRISNGGSQQMGVGYVVNMVCVDVNTLQWTMDFLSFLWATPVIITISIILLWQQLGPACLAGLLFLLVILPTNSVLVARVLKQTQNRMMKLKERRLERTSQILSGIRVLKFYAWENYFEKHLQLVRKQELRELRKVNLLRSLTYSSWQASPVLVILVCFVTYTLSSDKNILDAEKTFVSIAISNAMYFALGAFSHVISLSVQSLVSLNRIKEYLLQEEIERPSHHSAREDHSIVVQNGNFSWHKEACLSNINIEIPRGKLVAIVGKVGSGKSSLLSALLGEMKTLSGIVNTQGSMAYVSQQAWIQNLTLQDNILLSSIMNRRKYEELLDACALRQDLHIFPGGDMTEIGEKGINLSGGQKQRVSLARAVYSDRDIYLLDDPLSAVDAHVGKHIFDNVIGPDGILKDKTRILVTHAIRYLPYVDSIILMRDGCIAGIGSLQELSDNDAFVDCMSSITEVEAETGEPTFPERETSNRRTGEQKSKSDGTTAVEKSPREEKQLIAEETLGAGQIQFSVVAYLLKGAGAVFPCMLLVCMVLVTTSQCLTQLWLREWSQDEPVNGTQNEELVLLRVGVFAALSICQVLSIIGISTAIAFGGMNASFNLHSKLLRSVLRSPMSFFDTTPAGRILNRFSRDMDAIDQRMPFSSQLFLSGLLQMISTMLIVVICLPVCWAVMAPLVLAMLIIKKLYAINACQMQRIDAVCRSPVYALVEETILGRSSVRAYGQQENFIARMNDLLNRSGSARFQTVAASKTLCVAVQMFGNTVVAAAAVFGLVFNLNSNTLGMAVSFSLQMGSMLAMCVCNMVDLEVQAVSAERVKEYAELKSEAPWKIPRTEPPSSWPREGAVEFQNYQTRYRPGLDLVLKGINCLIKPGEKIGVVGRTGAGKSSLTLALFRMIEADGGAIQIDGRDISKLGLHDVRGRMSIIPQDPVVFSGTLQFNLDPSGTHSDHLMWDALEHAHLKSFVTSLPDGLQHECGEGGGNLSVGQRQLICLARALLHKSKILVLDEATAAVDMDTDELIQETIRTEFKNCTVITIAHRLHTILDYDRVMVMEDGRIREFDSPQALASDSTSTFHALAREAKIL